MDYKISFINFLKKNNIYEKFRFNFERENHMLLARNGMSFKKFLLEKKPNLYIYDAFTWSETVEGHDYWQRYSNKWAQYVSLKY